MTTPLLPTLPLLLLESITMSSLSRICRLSYLVQHTSLTFMPAWDPKHVIDTLVHATVSKYPKEQYVVGFDAQYNMMLLKMLPQRLYYPLVNWIIGRDKAIPAGADPSMKIMEQVGGEEEVKEWHVKDE